MADNNGNIVIYQAENGRSKIDVKLENETVWLTQAQLAELYQSSKSNISEHIKNIFEEGELDRNSVVRNFRTTATDGKNYDVVHYNLDVIISLGYRIKSGVATKFRIWATERIKEYIVKGFTMDDERLKAGGGGAYWKELLERIRDIRSSEKVLYRQVLDLYSTSVDYQPNAKITLEFFKIVQNKLHYAVHGNTASEIIFNRVDSDKEFMGLKTFKGELPTKSEAKIAKNYLNENELRILNNLVSGYFDFAEIQAERKVKMYMKDYIEHLDKILSATGENILQNAGDISHDEAMKKVDIEYKKYQNKTITAIEKEYLSTIKSAQKIIAVKVKTNIKNSPSSIPLKESKKKK